MAENRYLSATTTTSNANHTAVTRFAGFSIRESAATAAPAAVNFRHQTSTGQILFALELAANESAGIVFPSRMPAPSGVYVEVVSGTVSGVLYNWE